MSVWKGLGYNVIIFLAACKNIPRHLYEAARMMAPIAGNSFATLPGRCFHQQHFHFHHFHNRLFSGLLAGIHMTPRGGPLKSTMVVVYYLYRKALSSLNLVMRLQLHLFCS
jgi:hypothetical protein